MADNQTISNNYASTEPNFKATSKQLTDTSQLQIVALGVYGDGVAVLVDAINPLPVSGTFSASLASASSSNEGRVTAAALSTKVLDPTARKGGRILIGINSPESVNISFSGSASASSPLYGPGSIIPLADGAVKYVGAVYCFSAGGTGVVEYVEL